MDGVTSSKSRKTNWIRACVLQSRVTRSQSSAYVIKCRRTCDVLHGEHVAHASTHSMYAPSYDELDGGSAAEALGFSQLRAELLSKVSGGRADACLIDRGSGPKRWGGCLTDEVSTHASTISCGGGQALCSRCAVYGFVCRRAWKEGTAAWVRKMEAKLCPSH
eukprot:311583-Chlamydomonas_euryale.AAC.4